jgi:cellobiose phosphorylase
LWTDNGVRIEKKDGAKEPDVFWDRGTLYAFRGAFKAGASDKALGKLTSYSATRLLGFHVPYVVEAWPEGGMAHLSAESALYCRIFTEGILGFEPTGFGAFSLQPNLPAGWQTYRLKNIGAFGSPFDIEVIKKNGGQDVNVSVNRKIVWSKHIKAGEKVQVVL